MEKIIYDTLHLLGLSEKEIKFYLASFALGPATIQEVIKKSRLERSTAYLIFQELLKKGLLEEDHKQYKKTIVPAEPKTLLRMLSSKQRVVRRQEIELSEKLPELEAIFKTSDVRPYVRVFEGSSALLSVWEDVLKTKNEILLWTNQKTENLFFTKEFHEKFIKERIEKGIPIRVLAVNNAPGRSLNASDTRSLRKSKLLPIQTSFSSETYIYDSKVAILDYNRDVIGIILESMPIADTQRAIFEMTWENAYK
jgi:HTH-type transcriptional regulator, sugar sensing transcriptional regulator